MKIASWNIAGSRTFLGRHPEASVYGYGKENMRYFEDSLRRARADVILLQEVHASTASTTSQADQYARNLGMHATKAFPYSASHIQKDQSLSLATLSKESSQQNSFYELPDVNLTITRPNGDEWVSFKPTGFFVSEFDYQGERVTVANAHLHPFHYFKRDFSEPAFQEYRDAIANFFMQHADSPTIIAGDFNYADLHKLFPQIFTDGLYKDAFIRSTTPEKGQQDHILFSRHWKLDGVDVVQGSADHYLCIADLSCISSSSRRNRV